jgi:hypothetical protein
MNRLSMGRDECFPGNTLPTPVSVGTTAGATVSLAADTSFGCLTAKLTPPSANTTDVWHGAISVTSLELQ